MLMVVFGAGASFDSVQDLSHRLEIRPDFRPPLANDLFADRAEPMGTYLRRYPDVAPVAAEVRAAAGARDVEDILTSYQQRSGQQRVARQLLATRYYLKHVLSDCSDVWAGDHDGVTNYVLLLELIARREDPAALLVTFNYDTLIERALTIVNHTPFDDLRRYVEGPTKLIKAHGSVTWGRIIGMRRDDTIQPEQEVWRADPVMVLAQARQEYEIDFGSVDRNGNLLIPAIAVPLRAKDGFECPQTHQHVLEESVPSIDSVISIGWRGGEADFVDLLRRKLSPQASFHIVSTERGLDQTRGNLLAGGVTADFRGYGSGFSAYMRAAVAKGHLPESRDLQGWDSPTM